jgi:hypothetical protein
MTYDVIDSYGASPMLQHFPMPWWLSSSSQKNLLNLNLVGLFCLVRPGKSIINYYKSITKQIDIDLCQLYEYMTYNSLIYDKTTVEKVVRFLSMKT